MKRDFQSQQFGLAFKIVNLIYFLQADNELKLLQKRKELLL